MIKNTTELPENYKELLSIDLQKDKKTAIIVNVVALTLFAVLFVIGVIIVPFTFFFDMSKGLIEYSLPFIVLILGTVLYIFLHELVHGVFMRILSGIRPHYGFTGMYAYAGSSAFFNKKSYIIIALAPIVIWGIVLAFICNLVPERYFWAVYIIQCMNISGAAGDIYVTIRFLMLPKDILVNDTGVAMKVYAP